MTPSLYPQPWPPNPHKPCLWASQHGVSKVSSPKTHDSKNDKIKGEIENKKITLKCNRELKVEVKTNI